MAAKLGIHFGQLAPYGGDKAKLRGDFVQGLANQPNGKLIFQIKGTSGKLGFHDASIFS